MKKEYLAPMTSIYELNLQSVLASSVQLKYTNESANQEFEVLSNSRHEGWNHEWE
jgi:hypothetical protein